MKELKTENLFDLSHTAARSLLERAVYPWEALGGIAATINELGSTLDPAAYDHPAPTVWIHKTARVAPTAFIGENVIIGRDTEIRHCAFIRENALIGEGAVVGNSTELKNVILFDGVQVPHYNYVGDSILGYKAHMGAGAITSNVKGNHSTVSVTMGENRLETGLKKFGAILGDYAEIGCGTVLNPGSVVGQNAQIYPLSMVRGYVPANSIYKKQGEVVIKK